MRWFSLFLIPHFLPLFMTRKMTVIFVMIRGKSPPDSEMRKKGQSSRKAPRHYEKKAIPSYRKDGRLSYWNDADKSASKSIINPQGFFKWRSFNHFQMRMTIIPEGGDLSYRSAYHSEMLPLVLWRHPHATEAYLSRVRLKTGMLSLQR